MTVTQGGGLKYFPTKTRPSDHQGHIRVHRLHVVKYVIPNSGEQTS